MILSMYKKIIMAKNRFQSPPFQGGGGGGLSTKDFISHGGAEGNFFMSLRGAPEKPSMEKKSPCSPRLRVRYDFYVC
jgi:hypothetical protein